MSDKVYKSVKLTELEYHKLMRFSEAVAAVSAQAELQYQQLRERVTATQKVREDYFNELMVKYPELDKFINYIPVEAEFELQPQELDAAK